MEVKIVPASRKRPSGSGRKNPSGRRSRQDPPELFFENCPDAQGSMLHDAVILISGREMLIAMIWSAEQRYPSHIGYPVANALRSTGVIERSPMAMSLRKRITRDSEQSSTVVS
jgi:hypothetical protein